jgi:hypothetical protein
MDLQNRGSRLSRLPLLMYLKCERPSTLNILHAHLMYLKCECSPTMASLLTNALVEMDPANHDGFPFDERSW